MTKKKDRTLLYSIVLVEHGKKQSKAKQTINMTIELHPVTLTAAAFALFGDVIETQGSNFNTINFGRTERHHDLAKIDTLEQDGHTGISIFRSQPLEGGFPCVVKVMERHPLSSQAFISMQRKPFLVLVAPPTDTNKPDVTKLQLFQVGANQGINFHRGVWHHYSFALGNESTDFLCVDRCGGNGTNCDEYYFKSDNNRGPAGKQRGRTGQPLGDDSATDEEIIIHET